MPATIVKVKRLGKDPSISRSLSIKSSTGQHFHSFRIEVGKEAVAVCIGRMNFFLYSRRLAQIRKY